MSLESTPPKTKTILVTTHKENHSPKGFMVIKKHTSLTFTAEASDESIADALLDQDVSSITFVQRIRVKNLKPAKGGLNKSQYKAAKLKRATN